MSPIRLARSYTEGRRVMAGMLLRRSLPAFLWLAAILVMTLPAAPAVAQEEGRLVLKLAPDSLPADGRSYPVLFVQLLDKKGRPIQPAEPTTVLLTSSEPEVAQVPSSVTIYPGWSYARVEVTVSHQAGGATVQAVARGYGSASATLTTTDVLGAEPPFRLALSVLPERLALGSEGLLTVAVVGGDDTPYLAPEPLEVHLSTNRPDLVDLPELVTIPRLSYRAQVPWRAKGIGKAGVVAQADGALTSSAEVTLYETPPERARATSLSVAATVGSLPAWEGQEYAVLIQARGPEGEPVPFPCTELTVTSSDPRVLAVGEPLYHPCSTQLPYLLYQVSTPGKEGQAMVTAAASGLTSGGARLEVNGLQASGLAASVGPAMPLAADPVPAFIAVQVRDPSGLPVTFHPGYEVSLVGQGVHLPPRVDLGPGGSLVILGLSQYALEDEEVSVLATADGLEGASATFTVETRALSLTLELPTLVEGREATLTAQVTSEDEPVTGARVTWELGDIAEEGTVVSTTDESGIATVTVVPTRGGSRAQVKARATFGGFSTKAEVAEVVVQPAPATGGLPGPSRLPFLIILGAIALSLALYLAYSLEYPGKERLREALGGRRRLNDGT